RKIRVNVISPGFIETPIFNKAGVTREQAEKFKVSHAATAPMGRISPEGSNTADGPTEAGGTPMTKTALKVRHPHIVSRKGFYGGRPVIAGTKFPVRAVVNVTLTLGLILLANQAYAQAAFQFARCSSP